MTALDNLDVYPSMLAIYSCVTNDPTIQWLKTTRSVSVRQQTRHSYLGVQSWDVWRGCTQQFGHCGILPQSPAAKGSAPQLTYMLLTELVP